MIRREVQPLEARLSSSRIRRALFVYEMAKSKKQTKPETLIRMAWDVIHAAREVGEIDLCAVPIWDNEAEPPYRELTDSEERAEEMTWD